VTTYWDTSAAINAFLSLEVFQRLDTGRHCTRLHTLAEIFSTMTGRGIPVQQAGVMVRAKLSPEDCAVWLRQFAEKMDLFDLDKADVLSALDKAQTLGIQGGRVYDYLHAAASKKAKADELLTRNTDDFKELADNIRWP